MKLIRQYPPPPLRYRVTWWEKGRLRRGWTSKDYADKDDALAAADLMYQQDRTLQIRVYDLENT